MKLKPPTLKCPFCGAAIANTYVAGEPLTCQDCQRQLMMSPWHLRLTSLGGTVVTILLCLLLGLQGVRLLVAIVLLWFPLSLLWTFLLNALLPPRLESYVPKIPPKKPNGPGAHSSSLDLFHR